MTELNVLLSVCIPTYNRFRYLKESLDVLLPQAQQHGVEVCVSDNYSTDETANYLNELTTKYPCLRYVTQDRNIGLDKNMGAAIAMGSGVYLYPLGDDDVIPAESLCAILRELEEGVDAVVQNGWHTDSSLSPKMMHLPVAIQASLFTSPANAFDALWDKMPFGSFLATRECFEKEKFTRYVGTSHAYTGAIWDALAEKYETTGACKVKCMSQPTVLLRGGEKSWRNDAALIMLYEIPRWFSLVMEKEVYKRVVGPIRLAYIQQQIGYRTLLQYRAIGQLGKPLIKRLALEYSLEQMKRVNIIASLPQNIAGWLIHSRDLLRTVVKFLLKK